MWVLDYGYTWHWTSDETGIGPMACGRVIPGSPDVQREGLPTGMHCAPCSGVWVTRGTVARVEALEKRLDEIEGKGKSFDLEAACTAMLSERLRTVEPSVDLEAACAVMREALESCLRYVEDDPHGYLGDCPPDCLGCVAIATAKKALASEAGNELLERLTVAEEERDQEKKRLQEVREHYGVQVRTAVNAANAANRDVRASARHRKADLAAIDQAVLVLKWLRDAGGVWSGEFAGALAKLEERMAAS